MKSLEKLHPALIGLIQTVGVTVYCGAIATFFFHTGNENPDLPQNIIMFVMLMLLVFSAGITGFLVFGYSAYLALNKKTKQSLNVLGYPFLFSGIVILGMIALIALNVPATV